MTLLFVDRTSQIAIREQASIYILVLPTSMGKNLYNILTSEDPKLRAKVSGEEHVYPAWPT